jgi:hypothetical protein
VRGSKTEYDKFKDADASYQEAALAFCAASFNDNVPVAADILRSVP